MRSLRESAIVLAGVVSCSGGRSASAPVDDGALDVNATVDVSTEDQPDGLSADGSPSPIADAAADAIADVPDGPSPTRERCAPLPEPKSTDRYVSTVTQLRNEIAASKAGTTIVLEDGTYNVVDTIAIAGHSGVTVRGRPGHRDKVILKGTGAKIGCPDNRVGFQIDRSKDVTLSEMTIIDMQCHAVQVQATGSSRIRMHRLVMLDSGQQVVKSSAMITEHSDDGIVECSTIGFTTTAVPAGNTYTQGVDVHGGARWIVRDNLVKNIRASSTSGEVVAGAISLWNGSFDSIVERNVVIDCWQGIQLGGNSTASSPDTGRTGGFHHVGGVVRNNVVVRALDFGIQLARAKGAKVHHNTVWTPGYTNSIETRAQGDVGSNPHWVRYNLVSGVVGLRDGDTSTQVKTEGNLTATTSWFVDAGKGDFHLVLGAKAIDSASPLPAADIADDIDGDARPWGKLNDVGADEFAK